jgi:hypothetical protein
MIIWLRVQINSVLAMHFLSVSDRRGVELRGMKSERYFDLDSFLIRCLYGDKGLGVA